MNPARKSYVSPTVRLGDFLVSEKLLTREQLNRALQEQSLRGDRLGTCIIDLGFLTADKMTEVLGKKFRLPRVTENEIKNVPEEIIKIIPKDVAEKYEVVPYKVLNRRLYVAMSDPTNLLSIDELSFRLGYLVQPAVASELVVFQALKTYYHIALPARIERVISTSKNRLSKSTEALTSLKIHDNNDDDAWPLLNDEESEDRPTDDEIFSSYTQTAEASDFDTDFASGPLSADDFELPESKTVDIGKSEEKRITALEIENEVQKQASVVDQLLSAESVEEVYVTAFSELSNKHSFGLFEVLGEFVRGQVAVIDGELHDISLFRMKASASEFLSTVLAAKLTYDGPSDLNFDDHLLLAGWFNEELPSEVMIAPIYDHGKIVSFLYSQDKSAFSDVSYVADKISAALEYVDARQKLRQ